jgi:hypothetical protein
MAKRKKTTGAFKTDVTRVDLPVDPRPLGDPRFSTPEQKAFHAKLSGPPPEVSAEEREFLKQQRVETAERQRDHALKALSSRANMGQTIKRLDEVLAAVESGVKRLQAIARALGVGDD